MNIDNIISSFNPEKFRSDCLVHDFMKTYIKRKSELSLCDEKDAELLSIKLKDYSDILQKFLKTATCFPKGCKNCVGMQKCAGCIYQDILAEAFMKLQKYL